MELPPGADTDYFREPYLRLRVWYVDSGSGGSLDALVFVARTGIQRVQQTTRRAPSTCGGWAA